MKAFSFDQKNAPYFFKASENYVFEGVMDTSEESYSNITHSETAKKMIAYTESTSNINHFNVYFSNNNLS